MDIQFTSRAIVRILDPLGEIVGLGVYVPPDIILTCRHVIDDALGEETLIHSQRGLAVQFDAPFEPSPPRSGWAEVVVDFRSDAGAQSRDFAVLRLRRGDIKLPVEGLPALNLSSTWHRPFTAFGCPAGHDSGVWTTGRILGPTTSGLVGLQAEGVTGYQIEHGFSGGPVFDMENGSILGIVVSRELSRTVRGGFMLPVHEMVTLWSPLRRRAIHLAGGPPESPSALPAELSLFVYAAPNTAHEGGLLEQVVARVNSDPLVRGMARLDIVAWTNAFVHDPRQSLFAEEEAAARGLRRPSESDTVILILWNDPGDPVIVNGSTSQISAIEWVIDESQRTQSGDDTKPSVHLLHRQEPTMISTADPNLTECVLRSRQAEEIVADIATIAPYVKIYPYKERSSIELYLETILREMIGRKVRYLDLHHHAEGGGGENGNVLPSAIWPYPGLRTFRQDDRGVFFGRQAESNLIVGNIEEGVAPISLIGASGSGKSSLINAGVISLLDADAIPGSSDWIYLKTSPAEVSDDPVVALASGLHALLPVGDRRPRDLLYGLRDSSDQLERIVGSILSERPRWSRLVVIIDQFEELLSFSSASDLDLFAALLQQASRIDNVSLVLVIRADFVSACLTNPALAHLVKERIVPLGSPSEESLYEIVSRPAAVAGLAFEDDLADVIVHDAVATRGSLPLLAYAMAELEPLCISTGVIGHEAYESIGGVHGALARQAAAALGSVETDGGFLDPVFEQLVSMQPDGSVVRRKLYLNAGLHTEDLRPTIETLVGSRLLTASATAKGRPFVELTHESLMEHWPALKSWIERKRGTLRRGMRRDGTRESEMVRRRSTALERSTAGRVFLPTWGPYDGRYAWITIDRDLYVTYFHNVRWRHSRAPGLITPKITVGSMEDLPIIFRLRGANPDRLGEVVSRHEKIIGEFWPNTPSEGFRGVNLVVPTSRELSEIDLRPKSETVFRLSVVDGELTLLHPAI